MSGSELEGQSVLVPADDVYVVTLDDEKVLFVPETMSLQHLDRTAALVWDCLLPPAPVAEIVADLANAFRVDRDVVASDVLALLTALRDGGAVSPIPKRSRAGS